MSDSNRYDVVIAGGGLGGLLSALILAKNGMKVCVLEKDKQAGGCLQTFSLQKKVFDSCVHYIGGLGEGHMLNRIFSYAGIMDKLQLKGYDPDGFDRIAFDNEEALYPHAIGNGNFVEQLLPYFPNERLALEKYVQAIKHTCDHFPLYRLRHGDPNEKAAVSGISLNNVLADITKNALLQNVLTGNNMLYAGEPDKTPFYVHALVMESYMHSTHKVLPGSSQITKYLTQVLQEHGGELHRNTEVVKLKEEHGAISYAETADGQHFYGKQFIAGMHPATLLRLIEGNTLRPAYRTRIEGLQQTISSFMLNIVVQPGQVRMRHYNLYWNATKDSWAAVHYKPTVWPANYTLFYTEDPEHPGYAESISALSYMHYSEVQQWAGTTNRKGDEHDRGEAYTAFKQERTELLLQKIYERVPELAGNIVATKSATPLTYRDYTGTPGGALYGILKNVNRPAETTVPTRTRIPNLLLTGQNVNLHGVLGVSITAIATSAELLGMEHLLNQIQKQ